MANSEVIVVVEVRKVVDRDSLQNYQSQARQQIGRYGGTVLARGGTCFEGDAPLSGLLLQRWPSEAAFRKWQASEEYRPLLELRRRAAEIRLIIVPVV